MSTLGDSLRYTADRLLNSVQARSIHLTTRHRPSRIHATMRVLSPPGPCRLSVSPPYPILSVLCRRASSIRVSPTHRLVSADPPGSGDSADLVPAHHLVSDYPYPCLSFPIDQSVPVSSCLVPTDRCCSFPVSATDRDCSPPISSTTRHKSPQGRRTVRTSYGTE
jgi:hypothetical protein